MINLIVLVSHEQAYVRRFFSGLSSMSQPGKIRVLVVAHSLKLKEMRGILEELPVDTLVIPNDENCLPAQARNKALEHVHGGIVYFCDDDVLLSSDIFDKLEDKFRQNPDVSVIGGPNLTPAGSSFFQRCCGYVLASYFATASMSARYRKIKNDFFTDERSLILCNLAMRAEVFEKGGFRFHARVACAEENLLLSEMKSKGYTMLYSPDIVVYHERRKNLSGFAGQLFKYGRGRGQMIAYMPLSFSMIFLVPTFFTGYLFTLPFSGWGVYMLPLGVYMCLNLVFSAITSGKEKEAASFWVLLFLFPFCHICYGAGFLRGISEKRCRAQDRKIKDAHNAKA